MKIIKFIRGTLVIISCLLLIFSIFAWVVELEIRNSQWLPIVFSSMANLFLLFFYWILGTGYIKPFNIQENRTIRVLSMIGFGGNIVLLICCILIVIGFGIIP